MPTLPTLTVTQAQFDRIAAVFGNSPVEYRTWLVDALSAKVFEHERRQMLANFDASVAQKMQDVDNDIGNISTT